MRLSVTGYKERLRLTFYLPPYFGRASVEKNLRLSLRCCGFSLSSFLLRRSRPTASFCLPLLRLSLLVRSQSSAIASFCSSLRCLGSSCPPALGKKGAIASFPLRYTATIPPFCFFFYSADWLQFRLITVIWQVVKILALNKAF